MKTKYKAMLHLKRIEKVQVERETHASVWINGNRTDKKNKVISYFDTFDEAKDWMIHSKKAYMKQVENTLEGIKETIKEIENIKKAFNDI